MRPGRLRIFTRNDIKTGALCLRKLRQWVITTIERTMRPIALAPELRIVVGANTRRIDQRLVSSGGDLAVRIPCLIQLDRDELLLSVIADTFEEAAVECVCAYEGGQVERARAIAHADGFGGSGGREEQEDHRTDQSRGKKSTWGPGSIMNTASVARTQVTAAIAIAMWNPENS